MENLHPIAVHFPIALLVLYSLMEIVSLFTRVRNNKVVRYIKLFLLLTGRLGLQASLSTGEAAADAGNGVKGILERHETFAGLSNTLYGIVTIGYLIERFINDRSHTNR